MINKLPVIGWLLSICASISLSIPFWICWTAFGLGAKYFYWMPEVYQRIPFWNWKEEWIAEWRLDQKINEAGIPINLNMARTVQWATGALTTQRTALLQARLTSSCALARPMRSKMGGR